MLVVEDDRELGPLIAELLADDFGVTLAATGQAGLHRGLTESWDAIVVDRGLPVLDGIDLVRALRSAGRATPVLVLTALGTVQDRVDGLDAGANDYLVKPFDAAELAARLRALTRSYAAPAACLRFGAWTLTPATRSVESDYGQVVSLSPREAELLALLATSPDRVFSRDELVQAVFDSADQRGVVDTYVHYLRRKLGRAIVRTVHGAGYQLGVAT